MWHNHSCTPHYQKQASKPSFLVQQLVLAHFKQQVCLNFTSDYLQCQMFLIHLPTLRKQQLPLRPQTILISTRVLHLDSRKGLQEGWDQMYSLDYKALKWLI